MSERQLPISEYQKRFLLEWAINPNNKGVNFSLVFKIFKINGNLNIKALKKVCALLVQNNEIFHAKYNEDGSACYYANYSINDFYSEANITGDSDIKTHLGNILKKPFDLTQDVLIRFYLLRNDLENEYHLICPVAHHIVANAHTNYLCMKDIQHYYNLIVADTYFEAKYLDKSKKTFLCAVFEEQSQLNSQDRLTESNFWLNFINDIPLSIDLPYKLGYNREDLDN